MLGEHNCVSCGEWVCESGSEAKAGAGNCLTGGENSSDDDSSLGVALSRALSLDGDLCNDAKCCKRE